jgi:hypothetical protein
LRQIRCPLRNNLLQGQRSPQALLLVTQLVRCASRQCRNNGQKVKYHCSKDTPFSLSIDLFSFDDSIVDYRYSSAFIPRATPHAQPNRPCMSVSDRCMMCHTPCSAGGFDQAKRNCALQSESACDVPMFVPINIRRYRLR